MTKMIRHIVMWKLHNSADAMRFKHLLEGCKDVVPGMLEFEVGIRDGELEATHDVVLVSTFADRAVLEAYNQHPLHQNISKMLGALRISREVLDFAVSAPNLEDQDDDPAFAPTMLQAPF